MGSRRFSDEPGSEASARNLGRLALALIPAALALAAIWWASAAFGWFEFAKVRRMERRTLHSVGLAEMPSTPIAVRHHSDTCSRVDSSSIDGTTLLFYVTNTCKRWLSVPNFAVRVKTSDGTTIRSFRYAYDGDKAIAPSERREQTIDVGKDERIASVELWVID